MKCDCTRRQRLNDYGHSIFKSLNENLPDCKLAQLSLSLGEKTVNYTWKSKQLKNKEFEDSNADIFNFNKTADHSYASSKLVNFEEEDADLENIDYSKIFDSEGNWQQKHK